MNILFVLPVLSDVYYQKRIKKISGTGANCTVLGFEREGHYPGKSWPFVIKSLGSIQHGSYLKRIGTLFRAVKQIHQATKNKEVIYAFNLDILFVCWLARLFRSKKIKIIYDIADIREILIQEGFISFLLRQTERFLLKRASVVVVTSPAYIDGYFRQIQKVNHNFFVIENKVEENLLVNDSITKSDPKNKALRIGYFGMLRCRHSLQVLKQLMEHSNGSFKLNLRGIFLSTEQFESDFRNLIHSDYGGSFTYPDDLENMYSNIDLTWIAHMHGKTNMKWSISNRFYQACCFKTPMIAQKGTQDAQLVSKYKAGIIIDLKDPVETIHSIQSIGEKQISEWKYNLHQIPREVYTLMDEHERLLQLIKSID